MEGRETARTSVAEFDDAGYVSLTRPTECSLRAGFRTLEGPRVAWLPPDGPAVVGGGAVATIRTDGPDRFRSVRLAADAIDLPETRSPSGVDVPTRVAPRFLGGVSFSPSGAGSRTWRGFDSAHFVLPRVQLTETGDRTWITATAPVDAQDTLADRLEAFESRADATGQVERPPPGISRTDRRPDRAEWREQVTTATDRIAGGDLEKVVLAQRLLADLHGPVRVWDALARLGRRYPECFRFAIDPGVGGVFFGATPERLVSLTGRTVRTEALAGSIGRGGTSEEDDRLAAELRSSPKVREEHAVVVETLREQLAEVGENIAVGERRLRRLANVQHLLTPITARVPAATHVVDLVAALHPTPAVGGRPPERAQAFIDAVERFDRGWYAAPIGWFTPDGDGTFAVGIRSAVASGHRATLFAGNGIVADSDPDREWDELQLKYRPILDTLRSDAADR